MPYPARQARRTEMNIDKKTIMMLFLKNVPKGYSFQSLPNELAEGLSGIHVGGTVIVSMGVFKEVDTIQSTGSKTIMDKTMSITYEVIGIRIFSLNLTCW
jgi:hypothetical protein